MKKRLLLNDILVDNHDVREITNSQQLFRLDVDYDEFMKSKNSVAQEWKNLSDDERKVRGNKIERFFRERGIPDEDPLVKNYWLVVMEAAERIEAGPTTNLLPLSSLYLDQSLFDLLENLENVKNIQDLYRMRKLRSGNSRNAGIATEEAEKVRNCLRQGRELYLAGRTGSLMIKPLNFFYSLTAYGYAIILLNNPIRYSIENLPGSHGLIYLNREFKSQFGGDTVHGALSELVFAFPTIEIRGGKTELIQDNVETLKKYFHYKHTTGMSILMSMIPELRDYYRLVKKQSGRTHPLEISQDGGRRGMVQFQIGDGEIKPDRGDLERAFPEANIRERYGKLIVDVASTELHRIRSMILVDALGDYWYIENPFYPIILPEIGLHFLIMHSLSNIMRYSPDQWVDILSNESNSGASFLIKRYLSAFEDKVPFMILRNASQYYPYVTIKG